MLTPADFLEATKYAGAATLTLAALTALAFVLGWGFRFRMVGITSFMGVLAVGMFGLSFEPFSPTVIAGSVPYQTVYDSGAAQIVITVPQSVTPSELEATLQQAASNLLKPSRLGRPDQVATIRARTLLHEEGGASRLLYLGQIQAQPNPETGDRFTVTVWSDALGQLPADNT
ncbi:MAG: Ycf51 family protein [Cyanobacteria bacterium]|nr:Ycf51 family protein [Cyanobacteriota bacterium]